MKKILLMLTMLVLGSNLYARSFNPSSINYESNKIQYGDMYQISSNTMTLTSNASNFLLIDMTSNTITNGVCMVFDVMVDSLSVVEIIENTTFSSSGTAITAYNNNRNYTNNVQAGIKFYSNPTGVISSGTVVYKSITTINDNNIVSDMFVLKPGNSYAGKVTNISGSSEVASINARFYEMK